MKEIGKLFPPSLGPGSSGPAVLMLQMIISATGGALASAVRVNGVYSESGPTVAWVKDFQSRFQLKPDGDFGPLTRAAFRKHFGIDVDSLTIFDLSGPTAGHELSDREQMDLFLRRESGPDVSYSDEVHGG